jgi:hypothetical protein
MNSFKHLKHSILLFSKATMTINNSAQLLIAAFVHICMVCAEWKAPDGTVCIVPELDDNMLKKKARLTEAYKSNHQTKS